MRVFTATRLPALAFHGIFDAIGIEHVLAHLVSTRATPLLRSFNGVFLHIVGLLPQNHAVFHKHPIDATAAAIAPAVHRHPFALTVHNGRIGFDSMRFCAFDSRIAGILPVRNAPGKARNRNGRSPSF